MPDVTVKDREAYTAADSHEASALLSALRNMHCDRPHSIFGPPCERCLSTVHDALAARLGVIRRQARAEGRREEREAAANRFIASCPCENHDFSPGECETCHWFATGAEAIRARGEKGKD